MTSRLFLLFYYMTSRLKTSNKTFRFSFNWQILTLPSCIYFRPGFFELNSAIVISRLKEKHNANPRVCCLRSNETEWDTEKLWHTYILVLLLECKCYKLDKFIFEGLKIYGSEIKISYTFVEDRIISNALVTTHIT